MQKQSVKPCHLWEKGKTKAGYAYAYHDGVRWLVHRLAYYLTHPDENIESREVRHTCGVKNCIEPEHLYLAELHDPRPGVERQNELLGPLGLIPK